MFHVKPIDFQELPPSSHIKIQPNTPAEESVEVIQISTEEMSASDEIEFDANN